MKYMGSKNRIAKEILPIILKDRTDEQWYIEPFCGGLGTMDKVTGHCLASDKNKYLIAMWKGLQENRERPREISKELYSKARTEYNNKTNIEFDDFMIGWIGWMGSYNGRFFDGGYSGKASGRNYVDEQIRNTEKQIAKIQHIDFASGSYDEIDYPSNSIIYCDIPYKDTKQYTTSKGFDYDKFWYWCRNMVTEGHKIFVSEYNAPDDFIVIWEKKITNAMNTTKTYKPTEKLFVLRGEEKRKEKDNKQQTLFGDTK
jgi:DNA adenine methylase